MAQPTELKFSKKVLHYFAQHRRSLPWRDIEGLSIKDRGYKVVVSEFMLQQTQVQRVIPKYTDWMQRWPTIDTFVDAPFADVLALWSGLGYNRRARYIHGALQHILRQYDGLVPNNTEALEALPGIGTNTAGAIIVYTYNEPMVFIETNIRTVYLHEFFANMSQPVSDTQLKSKVAETLDVQNPRQWYYALMDYGTYIKKRHGTSLAKSALYKKQSAFEGSNRQIRGKIISMLTQLQSIKIEQLQEEIPDERLYDCIKKLSSEGMVTTDGITLRLPHS